MCIFLVFISSLARTSNDGPCWPLPLARNCRRRSRALLARSSSSGDGAVGGSPIVSRGAEESDALSSPSFLGVVLRDDPSKSWRSSVFVGAFLAPDNDESSESESESTVALVFMFTVPIHLPRDINIFRLR